MQESDYPTEESKKKFIYESFKIFDGSVGTPGTSEEGHKLSKNGVQQSSQQERSGHI